ncbi:AAA family ATPase [Marinifilum sp. JC120]|nr:AAA family ATPase [Marinifilum sp. JC120]
MARSDLLIDLVRAALKADRTRIKKVTEAIIAEERAKQHNILADRLTASLQNAPVRPPANELSRRPVRNGNGSRNGKDFIVEHTPRRSLDSLFLPQPCMDLCREIIEEQHRASVLRSHGLEPRHKFLLAGPPGNGKTSLAEALAYELNVPFFVVRYETVIGSFLGETSSRLKSIFDYARTTPCVLFFDEFDTLGKERGDTHETGEIKRVVSSLLLQIDDLPSYTVVISATNHSELLDKAVWRRFEARLELPRPTRKNLEAYFSIFLNQFEENSGYQPSTLAKHLCGTSYAEAEDFCLDIRRRYILSMGEKVLKEIIGSRLQQWKTRYTPSS